MRVVINDHLHRLLVVRRSPKSPGKVERFDRSKPEVSSLDPNHLVRHADQALDVANFRFFGQLEDSHVPPFDRPARPTTQEWDGSPLLHHVHPVA